MSVLSDLLNNSGVTARQAADKADELGVRLPYGTIAAYWAGKHPRNPSDTTLMGIAEVTGISLRRLRRAAGMPAGELEPWVPPVEANRLNHRQRDALAELIRTITDVVTAADHSQDWPSEVFDDTGEDVGGGPRGVIGNT